MESSRDHYLSQFSILSQSGVGVILTHARETNLVCDALHDWADAKNRHYKEWNVRDGWTSWEIPTKFNPTPPSVREGGPDALKALYQINDVTGDGRTPWLRGVFVMVYPHWAMTAADTSSSMIQCLKIYSAEFSEAKTMQRLVLVVPEGYHLPTELETDIPILDFSLPGPSELEQAYYRVIKSSYKAPKVRKGPYKEAQVQELVRLGAGMATTEFSNAVSKAVITNLSSFPDIPFKGFSQVISQSKIDIIKRSEVLEVMPTVPPSEMGGQDLYLKWIVKRKLCLTPEFDAFCNGRDKPKGVMFLGPSGTGKTLLGKVTAHIFGLPFFRWDMSKVFGKWYGESEGRMRGALNLLERVAPVVVLIDEFDKSGMGNNSDDSSSGTSDRVKSSFLTFTQETQAPIFWIFTANRVEGMDPSLVRKGRLDEVWAVLPPSAKERESIFRIHLRLRGQDDSIQLARAVARSHNLVPVEIESAVKDAVAESFATQVPITDGLIVAQLEATTKPTQIAFAKEFDRMLSYARDNARLASSAWSPIGPVRQRRRPASKAGG